MAEKEEPLGKVGTLKHWGFYVLAAAIVSVVAITVNDWRKGSAKNDSAEQIKAVAKDSIVPGITAELTKEIGKQFSSLDTNKIDPLKKELADLRSEIVKLRADVVNLEKWLPIDGYKTRAKKLGIIAPQVVPVSLRSSTNPAPEITPDAVFTVLYEFPHLNRTAEVHYEVSRAANKLILVARARLVEHGVGASKEDVRRFEIPPHIERINVNFLFYGTGPAIKSPTISILIFKGPRPNSLAIASGVSSTPRS